MEKIKAYIGFAKKSGTACFGIEMALSKKVNLIIYSSELAQNSVKKIQKSGVDSLKLSSEDFDYLGETALVIGITDKNLSKAILDSINRSV